jgi:predicted nuclease of predicted toxin-antitoxin system
VKFKVDENLPEELTQLLRDSGWDTASVDQQHLSGADDPRLAKICAAEKRILITFDRGFSNLKRYSSGGLAGIIVFRLKRQDKPHVLQVSAQLVQELHRRELHNELWIIHESRIRIRLLESPSAS